MVATEAMAATDPVAGMSMPVVAGMEPVAAVAAGTEFVGVELAAGLELAAAATRAAGAGGNTSQMTCTEAARGAMMSRRLSAGLERRKRE